MIDGAARQRLVQQIAADAAQVAAAEQRLGRAQHARELVVAVHAAGEILAPAPAAPSRSAPSDASNASISSRGRTVSQRRNRPTSASAVFSQNW